MNHIVQRRKMLAYVGGWLGEMNLGDELLFEAYKQLFRNYEFNHYNGGKLAKVFYKMSPKRGGGILGGGTLIGQIPQWLDLAREFQVSGDPFAILGTGVADPHFWPDGTPLGEWKEVLNSSTVIGVRGPMSAEYLADAGVEGVEVVGDPAIIFARKKPNPHYQPSTLALNFGLGQDRMWGTAESVRDEMIKLANLARRSGWRVRWMVVFPGDLEITMEAAKASNTEAEVITIYKDHERFMDIAGRASVFVGMKLHATILSTCAYTPSIMLEYRQKCRDYMQSIGHNDFVITTEEFDAYSCWERIQHMDQKRMDLSGTLMQEIASLRAQLFDATDRVKLSLKI
ncbi:MAG: polysaccharide pyruvyl transferase family protein [Verrucomicrobiae bacterium]|nr:polysaccharide pyruvyl transferase family protein [Verrucomicrobiae bacterium]